MSDRYQIGTDYRQTEAPAPAKTPKMWAGISLGNWITIAVLVGGGLIAYGRIEATAQSTRERLEKLEAADGRTRTANEAVKDKLGDLQGDIKRIDERGAAQQRQLDRIERLLDGRRPGNGPPP